MVGPGVPAGRVVSEQVGTVDVLPTLVALLGLPAPEGVPGRDLSRLFKGRELPRDALYSESLYGRLNCRWAPLRGWTERGFKLVEGGRSELFELAADPGERSELTRQDAARAEGMREGLRRALAAMAPQGDRAQPERTLARSGRAAARARLRCRWRRRRRARHARPRGPAGPAGGVRTAARLERCRRERARSGARGDRETRRAGAAEPVRPGGARRPGAARGAHRPRRRGALPLPRDRAFSRGRAHSIRRAAAGARAADSGRDRAAACVGRSSRRSRDPRHPGRGTPGRQATSRKRPRCSTRFWRASRDTDPRCSRAGGCGSLGASCARRARTSRPPPKRARRTPGSSSPSYGCGRASRRRRARPPAASWPARPRTPGRSRSSGTPACWRARVRRARRSWSRRSARDPGAAACGRASRPASRRPVAPTWRAAAARRRRRPRPRRRGTPARHAAAGRPDERRAAGACSSPPPRPRRRPICCSSPSTPCAPTGWGPTATRRPQTPALDRLAREGVLVEDAVVQVPQTRPSHASILTGRLPYEHGIRDNYSPPLEAALPTLADRAARPGYATGGFIGAYPVSRPLGPRPGLRRLRRPVRRGRAARPPTTRSERRAAEVVDAALALAGAGRGTRPFFAWVHLFDPHAPYEPPRALRQALRRRAPTTARSPTPTPSSARLLDWLDAAGARGPHAGGRHLRPRRGPGRPRRGRAPDLRLRRDAARAAAAALAGQAPGRARGCGPVPERRPRADAPRAARRARRRPRAARRAAAQRRRGRDPRQRVVRREPLRQPALRLGAAARAARRGLEVHRRAAAGALPPGRRPARARRTASRTARRVASGMRTQLRSRSTGGAGAAAPTAGRRRGARSAWPPSATSAAGSSQGPPSGRRPQGQDRGVPGLPARVHGSARLFRKRDYAGAVRILPRLSGRAHAGRPAARAPLVQRRVLPGPQPARAGPRHGGDRPAGEPPRSRPRALPPTCTWPSARGGGRARPGHAAPTAASPAPRERRAAGAAGAAAPAARGHLPVGRGRSRRRRDADPAEPPRASTWPTSTAAWASSSARARRPRPP